jgi:hypothetical protein
MNSRALMTSVVIIGLFAALQHPTKVLAEARLEEAKVLIDYVIQAPKANDTEKAQVHLSILNQKLPTFETNFDLKRINKSTF